LKRYWVVTDGRTDGRTDRITVANMRYMLAFVCKNSQQQKLNHIHRMSYKQ